MLPKRAPSVIALVRPLAVVEGVTILLITVELWRESVIVRVGGVAGEWMDELAADDRRSYEEWAVEQFHKVRVAIRDNVGTAYRMESASVGGSGFEWRGDWLFRPGVPESAAEVTVEPLGVAGTAVTVPISR